MARYDARIVATIERSEELEAKEHVMVENNDSPDDCSVTSGITIELRSCREDLSRSRPVSPTQGRAINNEAPRRSVKSNIKYVKRVPQFNEA